MPKDTSIKYYIPAAKGERPHEVARSWYMMLRKYMNLCYIQPIKGMVEYRAYQLKETEGF